MNILFALAALPVSRGDAEFRKENYIKSSHLSHHRVHSHMYPVCTYQIRKPAKQVIFLMAVPLRGGGVGVKALPLRKK